MLKPGVHFKVLAPNLLDFLSGNEDKYLSFVKFKSIGQGYSLVRLCSSLNTLKSFPIFNGPLRVHDPLAPPIYFPPSVLRGGGGGVHPDFLLLKLIEIAVEQQTRACDRTFVAQFCQITLTCSKPCFGALYLQLL